MRSFLKVCLVSHSHQHFIWGIALSLNHTRPFHSMLIHTLVLFNHVTLLLNILTLSSHLSFLQHKTPWSPYLTWTRPIEPINLSLFFSDRQKARHPYTTHKRWSPPKHRTELSTICILNRRQSFISQIQIALLYSYPLVSSRTDGRGGWWGAREPAFIGYVHLDVKQNRREESQCE